jgi:hypothetical protein
MCEELTVQSQAGLRCVITVFICCCQTVFSCVQGTFPRPSSESVQDIQTEIRGWVINKGLGETLLHRAARLGYTVCVLLKRVNYFAGYC